MKHYSYSSIPLARNFIAEQKMRHQYVGRDSNNDPIYDESIPLPVIKLHGTVKLHGVNASVVYTPEGDFYPQSRESLLRPDLTLNGFYSFAFDKIKDSFIDKMKEISDDKKSVVVVYGEWCGQGIKKSIGISTLPKMFVLFGIKCIDENGNSIMLNPETISKFTDHSIGVYNIYDFKTYEFDFDLNDPEKSASIIGEEVSKVEAECPVAKHFGISNGVGEGIVLTTYHNGEPFLFKVKGLKHKTSDEKTVVEIDHVKIENAKKFSEFACTVNRMEQGIDIMRNEGHSIEMKNFSKFIAWVNADIVKEEKDNLETNGLTMKDCSKNIANIALQYYKSVIV